MERRIANAAFDLVHTKLTVLEIAYKYHFSSHDSFTRAFHRLTGFTPSAFRANQIKTGRVKLCAGIYGVGIIKREDESK